MHLVRRMTAVVAAIVLTASIAAAQSVSVTINGQTAGLNPAPVLRAGRVFVPLRGVFEHLGASVVYDNGLINAQGNGRAVSLHIGSTQATINSQPQIIDVAPFIIGASTYVPLRFVAQALGAQVNWDNSNRIVAIVYGGAAPNEVIPPQAAAPAKSTITLQRVRPGNGRTVSTVRPTIEAMFANGTADPNTVHMRLDGLDVTSETTRSPNGVVYSPPSDLMSQSHHVVVTGRDTNGRPFDLAWSFTSGTAQTSNYIRNLSPADGQRVPGTFSVSGVTLPNSTVEIDAGASVSVGPIAFGGDHERIQATADGDGRFSQQVQLNAQPGQVVTVVITSTAPQTESSVRMTRHFTIG